jgi:hypothetical protein
MPTFNTQLLLAGKTATGIEIPAEVIEELGAGKKPPVRVTIAGHTYASTVASRGERFLVGVSAENREAAGVAAGDELEVTLELDDKPRELSIPADFAEALDAEPPVRQFFDGLTHSQRKEFARSIEEAKKPETRQRRLEKAMTSLRAGKKR